MQKSHTHCTVVRATVQCCSRGFAGGVVGCLWLFDAFSVVLLGRESSFVETVHGGCGKDFIPGSLQHAYGVQKRDTELFTGTGVDVTHQTS